MVREPGVRPGVAEWNLHTLDHSNLSVFISHLGPVGLRSPTLSPFLLTVSFLCFKVYPSSVPRKGEYRVVSLTSVIIR